MPQPYPNPSINGTVDLMRYTYVVTDGYISLLFVIACSIILFMLFKSKFYKTTDSISLASLITLILSMFLYALNLINNKIIISYLVLLILSVIGSFFED